MSSGTTTGAASGSSDGQQQRQLDSLAVALAAAAATVLVASASYCYRVGFRRRREKVAEEQETTKAAKPFDELPTPPGAHWLKGHKSVISNGDDLGRYLRNDIKRYANEYGQVGVWTFNVPTLIVTTWQDASTVLRQEYEKLRIPIFSRHGDKFFGKSNVVTMHGREWKYHRSVVLKAFAPATVESNRKNIAAIADTAVASILSRVDAEAGTGSYEIQAEKLMKMITLDVFGRVAFSKDLECTKRLRPSAIAEAFDFLETEFVRRIRGLFRPANFFYWIPTPANVKHYRQRMLLRSFLTDVIEERKSTPTAPPPSSSLQDDNVDLLSGLLIALEREDGDGGRDASAVVEKALNHLIVLLFAGYDTTSVTLSYATCLISQHPEVEEELVKELQSAGDALDDPEKLKYCEAVIREALRLYPPGVAATRYLQRPIKLQGGFVAPKNTLVQISIWLIHHDPDVFPQPDDFRPDRWVRRDTTSSGAGSHRWVDREETDDTGTIPAGNRKAFLAFSAGARSCAGQNLAMQEAVIVLANLHKSLRFRPKEGYVLKPATGGIIPAPADNLPMYVEKR